jgi:hypothetical protein
MESVIKKYRSLAKEKNMQLTVDREKQTFKLKSYRGYVEVSYKLFLGIFCMQKYNYKTVDSALFTLMLELIEAYAVEQNYAALTCIDFKTNRINIESFGFVELDGNDHVWSEVSFQALIETRADLIKELVPGFVDRVIQLCTLFNHKIKEKSVIDPTVTFKNWQKISVGYLKKSFYYFGKEIDVCLNYTENQLILTSDSNKMVLSEDAEEFSLQMDHFIDQCFQETYNDKRLLNLIDPPKVHFNEYVGSFQYSDEVKKQLFQTLSQYFQAEEIEGFAAKENFQRKKPKTIRYIYKNPHVIHLTKMIDHYFVIQQNEIFHYLPEQKDQAMKMYEDFILQQVKVFIEEQKNEF